jgi:hypothetical protein
MGEDEFSLLKWRSARPCDRNGDVSVKVQDRKRNWYSPRCAVETTVIDVDAAAVVVDAVDVVVTWKLSKVVDSDWKCCCRWLMNGYFLCPIERRVRTVHFSDDDDAAAAAVVAVGTGESVAVAAADAADGRDVD